MSSSARWTAAALARLGVPTDDADREQLVSDYFTAYVESHTSSRSFVLRERRRTIAAFAAALGLPRLQARLGGSAEGQEIRSALTHKQGFGRLPIHELSSVLVLPENRGEYALGHDRQTLRRQARKAERLGVTWSHVPESERSALVDQATRREQEHPLERYRNTGERNRRLLRYPLWLAAYGPDGETLMVSVTPVSGEWSALTYFRTQVDSPAATAARYLMTQVLVDELVDRGVRYLADSSSPIGLPNGLRHFQRMLGFRIHRIQLTNNT